MKNMAGVMGEFKRGALHSGTPHGPMVTNPKQAMAIGMSEQQEMNGPHPAMRALHRLVNRSGKIASGSIR
jgi:hypothetical protein